MKIDEIHKKVIESAQDIKHLRGDIAEFKKEINDLKKEVKEETKSCHERISHMKDVQNLNVGKLSVILMGVGAIIIGGVQVLIWLLGKIQIK